MEAWRSSPWRRAGVVFCLLMACLTSAFAAFYEWHVTRATRAAAALRAADVTFPPGPPVLRAPRADCNCRCRCPH